MNESSAPALAIQRSTSFSRTTAGLAALLLLILIVLPAWVDGGTLHTLVAIAVYITLGTMWNLLGGYGGLVSIGQQAFIGASGYIVFALANKAGVNPFVAWGIAIASCGLAAIPVSRLLFRLQGGYFAIGSWVIAEGLRLVITNSAALGGGSGMTLTAFLAIEVGARQRYVYWLAIATAFGSVALVYGLLSSRFGLGMTAMRDNERAAAAMGVDVVRTRTIVFVLSAMGFAAAGGVYFMSNLRISPDAAFGIDWSALVIFIVVIGGLGTIEGPIVGALLYLALLNGLSDYGTWYMIGLGTLAIVVTLYTRSGLWGSVAKRFDLHCFPVHRRVVSSSTSSRGVGGNEAAPHLPADDLARLAPANPRREP